MLKLLFNQQPITCILLMVGTSFVLGKSRLNHSYSLSGQTPVQSVHQKVNLKMPKFLPYPVNFPVRGSDFSPLVSRSHIVNTTSPPNHLGGLGLASGSQNRISLSALSKRPSQSAGVHLESMPIHYSEPRKHAGIEEKTSARSDHQPKQDPLGVNVRVIGQSVSNTLQPDLSPRKVRKLRRILAENLDTKWTSEIPPRVLRQRGLSGSMVEFDQNLVSEAQRLNFTVRKPHGLQYSPTNGQMQLFRTWLIELASCEMEYIWEDLGSLFWPRWIRRGVCLNTNHGNSCSWPPGMKCKPTKSRALKLLHWKCNEQSPKTLTVSNLMPVKPAGRTRRAFEGRYQRRMVTNTFHSSFRDMDPVTLEKSNTSNKKEPSAVSSVPSGRYTSFQHPRIGTSIQKLRRRGEYARTMSSSLPRWITSRPRHPRGSFNGESRQERQKRRARRLIKRLSVTTNGYHCAWQTQSYLINDMCSCSCV